MSFVQLKLAELQYAAEVYQLEGIDKNSTRKDILAAIEERSITWDSYKKFVVPDEDAEKKELLDAPKLPVAQPAEEKFDNTVLLKMDRKNFRYDIFGYSFTREHPFKVLSEDDAQRIIDTVDGFRIATPKEARNFYG